MGAAGSEVKRGRLPGLKKARTCREGTGPGWGLAMKLRRIGKFRSGCGPRKARHPREAAVAAPEAVQAL